MVSAHAIMTPKDQGLLCTFHCLRKSPRAHGPGDQGYRSNTGGIGNNDEEEVYLADNTDWSLDLSAYETCNINIRTAHEEVKDHDEQHGPRNTPGKLSVLPSGANLILKMLRETEGNKCQAPKILGITCSTLYGTLRRHGMMVPSNN
jgi:DNA-binding NtrC family response regulator